MMRKVIFKGRRTLPTIFNVSFTTKQNQYETPQILDQWRAKFQQAQIEDSNFTIKCFMAHILKKDFSLITDVNSLKLTDDQFITFERLCECRLARVPLQYILGEWQFRNITLKMQPTVFIPRPETEGLIDLIVRDVDMSEQFEFLEIGSGSGAISLSILDLHKNATSVAIDRSRLACNLTNENTSQLGFQDRIKIFNHTMTDTEMLPADLNGKQFNAIISNPPYIKTTELKNLAPEIKLYENLNALDGGPDGMKIAKLLLKLASTETLLKDGKLWMELDSAHPDLICEIIAKDFPKTLKYVSCHKDCFNMNRFVEILKI